MPRNPSLEALAGIQYIGLDGVSVPCIDAVRRLVQYGDKIEAARILTSGQEHALLVSLEREGLVAVKPGFASGYRGEGPSTFSEVLLLLQVVGAEIEEYEVSDTLIRRVGASALLSEDLTAIDAATPVRPHRWYDYIQDERMPTELASSLLRRIRPVVPWAIVDADVVDLALRFFAAPDKAIMDAFRRLEDKLRRRTGLDEHGNKLFSQAFAGEDSLLEWKGLDRGEQAGRAQLFVGAYLAFRNPRAHRELDHSDTEVLMEFLLVNQLFVLERQAVAREPQNAT